MIGISVLAPEAAALKNPILELIMVVMRKMMVMMTVRLASDSLVLKDGKLLVLQRKPREISVLSCFKCFIGYLNLKDITTNLSFHTEQNSRNDLRRLLFTPIRVVKMQ